MPRLRLAQGNNPTGEQGGKSRARPPFCGGRKQKQDKHALSHAKYTCHPSYKTIGSAVDRSARSVAKYVQELVEAALIRTEPTSVITRDGRKWNGNLRYTILPIRGAVDLYHERQLAQLGAGVQKKRKLMYAAKKRKQTPHAAYIAARSAHEPEELPL